MMADMYRRFFLALRLGAVAAVLCWRAAGASGGTARWASRSEYYLPDARGSLCAGLWPSAGVAGWTIRDTVFDARSALRWEGLDGDLFFVRGQCDLTAPLHLRAFYATGSFRDGRNTDEDYLSPAADQAGRPDYYSVSSSSGDTDLFHADLMLALPEPPPHLRDRLRGFAYLGLLRYREAIADADGISVVERGRTVNRAIGDGVNATYDFDWQFVRTGVLLEAAPVSRVRVTLDAALLWAGSFEGEGFWVERSQLRRTPPNIAHTADGGSGYDAALGLACALTERVQVAARWRRIALSAGDGNHILLLANGQKARGELTGVDAERTGLEFALQVFF